MRYLIFCFLLLVSAAASAVNLNDVRYSHVEPVSTNNGSGELAFVVGKDPDIGRFMLAVEWRPNSGAAPYTIYYKELDYNTSEQQTGAELVAFHTVRVNEALYGHFGGGSGGTPSPTLPTEVAEFLDHWSMMQVEVYSGVPQVVF